MAVFKHFALKEGTAIEFRAEAFNVFNHTEWLPVEGQAGGGPHEWFVHQRILLPATATSSTPAECTKRESCSSR